MFSPCVHFVTCIAADTLAATALESSGGLVRVLHKPANVRKVTKKAFELPELELHTIVQRQLYLAPLPPPFAMRPYMHNENGELP